MVNPVGGQSPAPMSAPVAAPTPSPAAAAPTPSPAAPTPSPTAAAPTPSPTAPPDVTGGVDSKTQFQVTQNLATAPPPTAAAPTPSPTAGAPDPEAYINSNSQGPIQSGPDGNTHDTSFDSPNGPIMRKDWSSPDGGIHASTDVDAQGNWHKTIVDMTTGKTTDTWSDNNPYQTGKSSAGPQLAQNPWLATGMPTPTPSASPAAGTPTPTPSASPAVGTPTPAPSASPAPTKLELGTKGSGDVINGVRGANGWDQNYNDGISYGDLKTVDVSKITDPDTKAVVQKAQQFAAAQSQPDNARIDIKTLNDWQGVSTVTPSATQSRPNLIMPTAFI